MIRLAKCVFVLSRSYKKCAKILNEKCMCYYTQKLVSNIQADLQFPALFISSSNRKTVMDVVLFQGMTYFRVAYDRLAVYLL